MKIKSKKKPFFFFFVNDKVAKKLECLSIPSSIRLVLYLRVRPSYKNFGEKLLTLFCKLGCFIAVKNYCTTTKWSSLPKREVNLLPKSFIGSAPTKKFWGKLTLSGKLDCFVAVKNYCTTTKWSSLQTRVS